MKVTPPAPLRYTPFKQGSFKLLANLTFQYKFTSMLASFLLALTIIREEEMWSQMPSDPLPTPAHIHPLIQPIVDVRIVQITLSVPTTVDSLTDFYLRLCVKWLGRGGF